VSSAQPIREMRRATGRRGSKSGVFCCNFQVRTSVAETPDKFKSFLFVVLVVALSKASTDMSNAKHLRAQRMIVRKMGRVSALPRKMTFTAHERNRPVSEEAVSVSPMVCVLAWSIADYTAALVSVVDLLPKVLPPIRI